jgi:hypothetical protein
VAVATDRSSLKLWNAFGKEPFREPLQICMTPPFLDALEHGARGPSI